MITLAPPNHSSTPDALAASRAAESPVAEPVVENRPRLLPPFKLILHNDDVNDFVYVIETIMELTPLTAEEAVERTVEAHESGHSVLLVTSKERAELYVEQFASKQLTTTCEPE